MKQIRGVTNTESIPKLIAWISICLLAAAWGGALDEVSRLTWAQSGAFGLVSAVGLGALKHERAARQDRLRDCVLKARSDCMLDRFKRHTATVDSINAAVARVVQHAADSRRAGFVERGPTERDCSTELLNGFPLEITPFDEHTTASDAEPAPNIAGTLIQILSRVVSFKHDQPLGTRTALLTFVVGAEQRFSFVVDVMWTQKADGGFASEGTVLAVGVPATDEDPVLAGCEPAAV